MREQVCEHVHVRVCVVEVTKGIYFAAQMWSQEKVEGRQLLEFKRMVGTRGQGRFRENSQQDAQEFLEFLLDELHEDVNLVQVKPYIEEKDSNGRTDAEVSAESW